MEEIWKDIDGYEGLYTVSNTGKVKSLRFRKQDKQVIIKRRINTSGTPYVVLSAGGKNTPVNVKELVAKAFVPNPNNYSFVTTIDSDPLNCNYDNLKWVEKRNFVSDNVQEFKYIIENNEGERLEFNKLNDVADYLDVVPSTVWKHINVGKEYNGWIITKQELIINKKRTARKNSRIHYETEDGWIFHKYIKGEEVVMCEKNLHLSTKYDGHDFGRLILALEDTIKDIMKDSSDVLYKKFITNYEYPKYTLQNYSGRVVTSRNFKIQIFVRFKDKPSFAEEVKYLENKLKILEYHYL